MEHVLKIKDEYYEAVASGFKRFEIRNDDRGYQVGDTIRFTDLDGNQRRGVWAITYILRDCPEYGLRQGYCILSIMRERMRKTIDGIDSTEELFKPGAKVTPELLGQLNLTLAGMKRMRATGMCLNPIDPNKVERGERLMILHILYERHYPYPKAYGYVAGEYEVVAVGMRYVTLWPTDANSLTGVVDREKGFRPRMLKVDSKAYNTFVIR